MKCILASLKPFYTNFMARMGFWAILGCCVIACSRSPQASHRDPDDGGLLLPTGFNAWIVADSTGRARHLAVDEEGDIYIKLRRTDSKGGIVALRDTSGDGKADLQIRFGGIEKDRNFYGTGMTLHDGYLYFSSSLVVYRVKLHPGELVPSSEIEVVLTDGHDHGTHWHITKPIVFDRKGFMYVPFGGPSNACQDMKVTTPNGTPSGKGLDPCPELDLHGGIWRFEAGKTGLSQKDGQKFATGIRSVVGMDWNPIDEQVYAVMHGRDNLHTLYSYLFSPWQNALLPAEELLRITKDADFGWPYCYYDQMKGEKVLAPEYGGNGEAIGRCADMDPPVMGFPGHFAPNDLLFYQGNQFPERYKQGAFVALHGSTNRTPYPQAGYFVAFVPMKDGKANGEWEVFADGFAGLDPIVNTGDAEHRPVGLAEGPDGSLYITESNKGKIWRILFNGDKENFGKDQLAGMEKRKGASHIRRPDPVEDDLQQGLEKGHKLYATYCATCHQQDGKGAFGRFPPLTANDWVGGDPTRLINLVLNGLDGPIEVNGEPYNSPMPPHAFLSDGEIADILTYIRSHFGNTAGEIKQKEVAELR